MSNRPSKYRPRCCNECAATYTPIRADELFCSKKCRTDFDNRATARGRYFYHLFMAHRYDKAKLMNEISQLGAHFFNEDRIERGGRKSWHSPARVGQQIEAMMLADRVKRRKAT